MDDLRNSISSISTLDSSKQRDGSSNSIFLSAESLFLKPISPNLETNEKMEMKEDSTSTTTLPSLSYIQTQKSFSSNLDSSFFQHPPQISTNLSLHDQTIEVVSSENYVQKSKSSPKINKEDKLQIKKKRKTPSNSQNVVSNHSPPSSSVELFDLTLDDDASLELSNFKEEYSEELETQSYKRPKSDNGNPFLFSNNNTFPLNFLQQPPGSILVPTILPPPVENIKLLSTNFTNTNSVINTSRPLLFTHDIGKWGKEDKNGVIDLSENDDTILPFSNFVVIESDEESSEENSRSRTVSPTQETHLDVQEIQKTIQRDYDNMLETEKPNDLIPELMPFQKQGLKWLLDQEQKSCPHVGGILADDMGLGKTIQILALILTNRPPPEEKNKCNLIICPLSTLFQWNDEIQTKIVADQVKVCTYYSNSRKKFLNHPQALLEYDIVLTTYGTLVTEFKNKKLNKQTVFDQITWYRVILDESQNIKNFRSKSALAACQLNTRRRYCLSGTPLQNNLFDLYSLLNFLRVDPIYNNFRWYTTNIINPIREGNADGYKTLHLLLFNYLLRRTKNQKIQGKPILTLPPCNVEKLFVSPTEEEHLVYRAFFEQAQNIFESYKTTNSLSKNCMHIFELILRLRQLCDHNFLVLTQLSDIKSTNLKEKYSTANDILQNMLNQLKQGNFSAADAVVNKLFSASDICIICHDELTIPTLTRCGHQFCKECIESWISCNTHCPICREKLSLNQLVSREKALLSKESEDNKILNQVNTENLFEFKQKNGKNFSLQSSKLVALMKELENTRQKNKFTKSIIFSQFTTFLDLIEILLERASFKFVRLDGSLSQVQRKNAITTFNSDPKVTIFLMSLKAGGVGLNLTAGSQVFILDPWWNPATEQQAIDRVHRFGQKEPVRVIHFIIQGTIEEDILKLQNNKRMIMDGVLRDNAGANGPQLRVRDLNILFKRKESYPIRPNLLKSKNSSEKSKESNFQNIDLTLDD